MDEFTFGMFGEMDDYNARREMEEWHETMDGEEPDDFAADYHGEQDFG